MFMCATRVAATVVSLSREGLSNGFLGEGKVARARLESRRAAPARGRVCTLVRAARRTATQFRQESYTKHKHATTKDKHESTVERVEAHSRVAAHHSVLSRTIRYYHGVRQRLSKHSIECRTFAFARTERKVRTQHLIGVSSKDPRRNYCPTTYRRQNMRVKLEPSASKNSRFKTSNGRVNVQGSRGG